MPVTAEEVRARNNSDVIEAMDKHGLTLDNLIKQLKRELKAKETKFFQKDGKVVEKHNVIAWDVRQRARIDAHKLRGDYPAEKREIMGDVDIVIRDCVKEAGDGD
jgi:hypothetical protein